ncbi:MAG: tRNA (adenosine(37)-N6)-threonylcarbamoyltransferase complex ATPase subunit type 1 TsaE [Chloroflexi bacterium]|nr:tRNA (adenosine(37)-N6)-threonylcarbamoyltransferase complex ATPase subunit type 1 TsaE [Chloroflexota bacterium]
MPILDAHSLEFISRSAEQTRRLGIRLGRMLQTGDIVCLAGDLGSGKTTLVQGIAAGWGSLDTVSSPTFVLVNAYRGGAERCLYHLDAYRLSGPAEALDLDLDELIAGGALVIEWADRIRPALPGEHLWVSLRWIEDEQRDLVFAAHGARYDEIVSAIRKMIFGVR